MSELLDYLVQNDESFRRARLPALYSDFRSQRTLNPDGFTANISAWKRGLSNAVLAGYGPSPIKSRTPERSHLTVNLDNDALLRSLESKQFGRPLALGPALQDALAKGEILPLQQFMNQKESIYHKGSWVTGIPWTVVSWGLRQVGLIDVNDTVPTGSFVVLANLEAAGNCFSKVIHDRASPFERTFSSKHFRQTFAPAILDQRRLSETDMDVLVKFLVRDKGLLATDGKTIKIRDSPLEDDKQARITKEDSAIASLKELMEDLNQQVDVLTKRVDALNMAAQDAVRKKNRVAALGALKSKKLAESNLTKRHATLNQLEEVAAKIEQAADNVALVRVMQSSTAALRNLNAKVGGADKVDEVLDDLREQMGEVDEVGNVIAESVPAVTVDETEVDDEFEAMLAEEKQKEDEVERTRKKAQKSREEEETKRKLAELDKLAAPVSTGEAEGKKEKRPVTPISAAAEELDGMHIDEAESTHRENQGPVAAE